jgi:hypothetical protein
VSGSSRWNPPKSKSAASRQRPPGAVRRMYAADGWLHGGSVYIFATVDLPAPPVNVAGIIQFGILILVAHVVRCGNARVEELHRYGWMK